MQSMLLEEKLAYLMLTLFKRHAWPTWHCSKLQCHGPSSLPHAWFSTFHPLGSTSDHHQANVCLVFVTQKAIRIESDQYA
eukprot:scaffold62013_cov18-Tisochrysis_lutea.AAC.1